MLVFLPHLPTYSNVGKTHRDQPSRTREPLANFGTIPTEQRIKASVHQYNQNLKHHIKYIKGYSLNGRLCFSMYPCYLLTDQWRLTKLLHATH